MFYLGRKVIRKAPGAVIKLVPLPTPVLIQGFGSRGHVGELCASASFTSVLLVTDKTIASLGLHEKVLASMEEYGIPHSVFSEIDSEPTIELVKAGRDAALEIKADAIVALGGGSVLDTAKIIASSARHPAMPIGHYLHKFAVVEHGSLPMVNIPTTAGTGAECTVGAVVSNAHGIKSSTVIIGLNVSHVILDGELIANAPKNVTAWSGIDALSHGLEGLMADITSTDGDVFKSRECVRLILENLPIALKDPHNEDARQATLLAAHYGGNAINTQLAGYVHAFAHSLGALYHIPHGKAIAWCLLPVVRAQKDLCLDSLSSLALHCGLADERNSKEGASDNMLLALEGLLNLCGLEHTCDALQESDYHRLIGMIDADSINYSPPKTFTDTEIADILTQIQKGC